MALLDNGRLVQILHVQPFAEGRWQAITSNAGGSTPILTCFACETRTETNVLVGIPKRGSKRLSLTVLLLRCFLLSNASVQHGLTGGLLNPLSLMGNKSPIASSPPPPAAAQIKDGAALFTMFKSIPQHQASPAASSSEPASMAQAALPQQASPMTVRMCFDASFVLHAEPLISSNRCSKSYILSSSMQ